MNINLYLYNKVTNKNFMKEILYHYKTYKKIIKDVIKKNNNIDIYITNMNIIPFSHTLLQYSFQNTNNYIYKCTSGKNLNLTTIYYTNITPVKKYTIISTYNSHIIKKNNNIDTL